MFWLIHFFTSLLRLIYNTNCFRIRIYIPNQESCTKNQFIFLFCMSKKCFTYIYLIFYVLNKENLLRFDSRVTSGKKKSNATKN